MKRYRSDWIHDDHRWSRDAIYTVRPAAIVARFLLAALLVLAFGFGFSTGCPGARADNGVEVSASRPPSD